MYEEDGSGAGRSLVAFRDGWGRTISVVRKDDHHDRSLTADQATRSATRRLQLGLAVASAVFTIGTALHNFAVIDTALIEQMMREPATRPDRRRGSCSGSGWGAASTSRATRWDAGLVEPLAVAVVDASGCERDAGGLGYVMVPSQMWTAVIDRYGVVDQRASSGTVHGPYLPDGAAAVQ
ncbi:hypothetical protein [Actinomadura sp. KC06]|uniref:hypothetical protein n=1 Tax=Actinomadura sp. KC06 TaxID=2530369 RepID=UPI001404B5D9|nr:hypothetical protein [Actinomadura sp. KC06]